MLKQFKNLKKNKKMKKGYNEYTPLLKKEKKKEKSKDLAKETTCSFTGITHPLGTKFVTEDEFMLQFGTEPPKMISTNGFKDIKTVKYPKTDGSNGKVSRFR
tara:strand:+ start:369 stop:674 length:306 start_codon:yes stop_codon:yes gene_type:complete